MCIPVAAALTAIPGVIGKVIDHVEKKQAAQNEQFKVGVDGDVKVNVEALKAEVENRRTAAANRGDPWMVWAFVGPTAFYYAAIVLDSVFQFGWDVAKMPPNWEEFAQRAALATVGVSAVGGAVRKLFTR